MPQQTPPKSLAEIRSVACNSILVTVTVLTVLGASASVLRSVEQGWQPIMGGHVLLALALIVTTLGRAHLSLAMRAGAVTAVPYVIAVGGLLAYGRGNGVVMFFVSSCVLAGCFFNVRVALGVVTLCVATVAAMHAGLQFGIIALPLTPAYDMSALSWGAMGIGLVVATVAPIMGLHALLTSLDAERQRTAEALRGRADFLGHMSHELRMPTAGLMGLAEALRGTRLDDQQKSYVTSLLGAGRNLFSVLNDLLDFAKFDSAKVPVENAPFSLTETVRSTYAASAPMAAEKGLTLDVEMLPNLHDALIGDNHRIGHELANLIGGAGMFSRNLMAQRRETPLATGLAGAAALFLTAAFATPTRAAEQDCALKPLLSAEMSELNGLWSVPMNLNGRRVARMMVDTGGGLPSLTQGLIAELGLNRRPSDTPTFNIKGARSGQNVRVDDVGLAGTAMPGGMVFQVMADVARTERKADARDQASDVPRLKAPDDHFDGTLTPDVFSDKADMELDFAGRRFNVFSNDHCAGKVVYWPAAAVAAVPFNMEGTRYHKDGTQVRGEGTHITFDVELDGKPVRAVLDTGANITTFDLASAQRNYDVDLNGPGVEKAGELLPGKPFYTKRFTTLTMEGISIRNPLIHMLPDVMPTQNQSGSRLKMKGAAAPTMLIGMPILRQLRIYIAFKERMLYITPAATPQPADAPTAVQ